jgi:hypothetical protein
MQNPVYVTVNVKRIAYVFLAIRKSSSPQQMPYVFDMSGNQIVDCNYFVPSFRQAVTQV